MHVLWESFELPWLAHLWPNKIHLMRKNSVSHHKVDCKTRRHIIPSRLYVSRAIAALGQLIACLGPFPLLVGRLSFVHI